jgi:hypothetical protein
VLITTNDRNCRNLSFRFNRIANIVLCVLTWFAALGVASTAGQANNVSSAFEFWFAFVAKSFACVTCKQQNKFQDTNTFSKKTQIQIQ